MASHVNAAVSVNVWFPSVILAVPPAQLPLFAVCPMVERQRLAYGYDARLCPPAVAEEYLEAVQLQRGAAGCGVQASHLLPLQQQRHLAPGVA